MLPTFPSIDDFVSSYARRLVEAWHPRLPVYPVLTGIVDVAADIYAAEAFNNPIAPLPTDPIEQGRWRDELRIHAQKMHDAPTTLALFTASLTRSLAAFRDALPDTALVTKDEFLEWQNRQPPLTVPSRDLIADAEQLFEELQYPFFEPEVSELRLFRELQASLNQSGVQATPLGKLFDIDVPFPLPDEARFSGHWIVSPPGRGKTTLLHAMVMEDIRAPDASLILMDSKGDLIEPIRTLTDDTRSSRSSSIPTRRIRSRSTRSTSRKPISRKPSTCSNTCLPRSSNSK